MTPITNEKLADLLEELANSARDDCPCDPETQGHDDPACPVPRAIAAAKELREKQVMMDDEMVRLFKQTDPCCSRGFITVNGRTFTKYEVQDILFKYMDRVEEGRQMLGGLAAKELRERCDEYMAGEEKRQLLMGIEMDCAARRRS